MWDDGVCGPDPWWPGVTVEAWAPPLCGPHAHSMYGGYSGDVLRAQAIGDAVEGLWHGARCTRRPVRVCEPALVPAYGSWGPPVPGRVCAPTYW
jgi:hypothetical protein